MVDKIESSIIGLGAYLPEAKLYNKDFEKSLDTTDEWIKKRTGITQRHIVNPGELTSDMAYVSAGRAMEDARIEPSMVDMIIVATVTGDKTFPSCAAIVQAKLGCINAFAFDVQAACSGFVYGMAVANNFIKSGEVKTVLLVGADSMSKIVDYSDRSTCILFGDGAGAMVITANTHGDSFIKTELYSDGSMADLLHTTGGVSESQAAGCIAMDGTAVFEYAVKKMLSAIKSILSKNNMSIEDIDILVPHQANVRIIDSLAQHLKIDINKVVKTVDIHANTSAASIPLALDHAWKDDFNNKTIIFITVGAGMTWGAALVKL